MSKNIKKLFVTLGVLSFLCLPSFAAKHEILSPAEIKNLIDEGNVEQLENYLNQYNNEDEKDNLDNIMKTKITPNGFSFTYGWSEDFCQAPLHYAAATGQEQIVDMLVNLDPAYLELKDTVNNATPLWCAAFNGKLNMVDRLRLKGAKITAQDKKGYDPLLIAIEKGYYRTFDYLIKNGANFIYTTGKTCTDGNKITGDTAMYAFFKNRYTRSETAKQEESIMLYKIINKHIEDGKDLNIKDKYGKTPLMYAVENQNPAYVGRLISKGADMDIEDNNGNDSCNYAVKYNNKHIESMVCVSRKIAGIDIADISKAENKLKEWFRNISF